MLSKNRLFFIIIFFEYTNFAAITIQNRKSAFNQQPRRKRRGTVLNVSHCVFYKVVAVGFNTLCYDASVGVLNPPHE